MKKTILIIAILLLTVTGCDSSIYSNYKVTSEKKESENYKTYVELNYEEYTKKINNKENFVILLYQTGCSHCATFEPKLNEIITYYNIEIYALNLADLSDEEYAIVKNKTFVSGTPTTVYIKEGKYESKMVGDKEVQDILDFLVKSDYLEEK